MPVEALQSIPTGWRILELGARADYFEVLNDIRRRGPVHDAGEGVFLIVAWDAVNDALRNPVLQAGSGVAAAFGKGSPVESVVQNWLMSQNGEEHRRARSLVARLFTPRALTALEPAIRDVAERLINRFTGSARDEPTDFVSSVAVALPCEVTRLLFGIDVATWRAQVEPLFIGDNVHQQDGFAAVQGLAAYFNGVVDNDDGQRACGGIIELLRAADSSGARLTMAEVIANSVLIVTAAIDTTAGLIANSLLRLIEHPAILARVVMDTALITATTEECLRHCPSAPSSTRYASQATIIAGVPVPAGANLFLSFSAANRDPARFENPDRFDIDRAGTASLTFGGGAHFCLGATLARMEAKIALETLFRHRRYFALAEPIRWRTNNPVVRLPERLMVI